MTTQDSAAIHDLPTLLAAVRQGERFKYVFFWGHQPDKQGAITKACFSQWWPATFVIDGVSYPTAEHYMMVEKARLFGDEEAAQKILAASHPRDAKNLGRTVANYDDARWEQHRFEIVIRGNLAKFGQNAPLRDFLLATAPRILVEASPLDKIWDIGLAETDERVYDPEQWNGLNLLGFALMQVRTRLAHQAE